MYRMFSHYVPKSLLILFALEALVLLLSAGVGVTVALLAAGKSAPAHWVAFLSAPLLKALLFAGVTLSAMTAMGLYQRALQEGRCRALIRIVISLCIGLMLIALLRAALPYRVVDESAFGIALLPAFLGIVACRLVCYRHIQSRLARRVLVIGCGAQAVQIDRLQRNSDQAGIQIVGYVDPGAGPYHVSENRRFSARASLLDLVRQNHVDEIVVALDDRRCGFPLDAILDCKLRGVHIADASAFYERQLGKMRVDTLRPSDIAFTEGFPSAVLKQHGKRILDVVLGAALLLAASPLMLIVAMAVKLDSEGPVIYRQARIGSQGKAFNILKFRSMYEHAEENGVAQWAREHDSRVTRVGTVIRKCRIDELPQLINVVKGEMSLVGPRPERPQFVAELSRVIPYYGLRHHVKPGVTGWAQIRYPYGATPDDAREKLQYDLYYMKNYSLFLDLAILVQTVQVVLWGKGAR